MSNPFRDIKKFHNACDQKPSIDNFKLYIDLIDEEWNELHAALENEQEPDMVEVLDALIDILVVTIGAINASNMDGEEAWREVMKTNFAKVDPETGKVTKREDGKILKPEGWEPPQLEDFVRRNVVNRKFNRRSDPRGNRL